MEDEFKSPDESLELRKINGENGHQDHHDHHDHGVVHQTSEPQTYGLLTEFFGTKPHKNPHSVSWRWPIIVLAAGCLLFYIVHLNDHALPDVVGIEEAINNPSLFSGERSRASLRKIVAKGPRVCGHENNEVYAPQVIEDEVNKAILQSHSSQMIKMQRQIGSGAYQLTYVPPFTNLYENVQNVLVMIEGSEGNHSILVNCHYDSVPEVQGASDDVISCAVMLELIRVLSASNKRLKHNVVFLFNGAEEVPLAASHSFLQHPWKEKCKIVLNLEAAGLGGRSLLFQSGPENPWIFKYYSKYAPHPHGQVLAEEMFQAGIIPSDTDFRIFRDFGGLVGLDFAFSRNGHVYHTRFDDEKYIPMGSYQHMGDNTLALLRTLGNAPEFDNMEKLRKGQIVYYDFLGWFMISYSKGGSIAINIFTILLAILSIVIFVGRVLKWSWLPESTFIDGKKFEKISVPTLLDKFKRNKATTSSSASPQNQVYVQVGGDKSVDLRKRGKGEVLTELGIAVGARVLGMGAAVAVTVIVACIVHGSARLAMPWYNHIWLIFPLYWCPCLVVYALVPHFIDIWRSKKHGLPLHVTAQMNLIASFIPWIFIYFIVTCSGLRSAAYLFIPIFSSAISHLIIQLTPLYQTAHKWVWVYLGIHIPALLMTMYLVLMGYITLWPVMARSGVINGDVQIALISSLQCLFLTSFAIPLVTLIRRPGNVFALLTLFSIIMIIVSLSTDIGHPYSSGPGEPRPQRYQIAHTLREFRNESQLIRRSDSGYFVLNYDENSPKTIPKRKRSNILPLAEDCKNELYCGVPLYTSRWLPLSPTSSWIPASPPIQPFVTELKLVKRECLQSECSLTFLLSGPGRMTLTFSPREGAELTSWSIPSPPAESQRWNGRPAYFIYLTRGKISGDYEIKLNFKVSAEQLAGKPIGDFGLSGNHVHHEDKRTKEFQDLLDSFPDWVQTTGWISAYKGYVF